MRRLECNVDENMLDALDKFCILSDQPRDSDGTSRIDARKVAYSVRMNTVQIDTILTALSKHSASIQANLTKIHKP